MACYNGPSLSIDVRDNSNEMYFGACSPIGAHIVLTITPAVGEIVVEGDDTLGWTAPGAPLSNPIDGTTTFNIHVTADGYRGRIKEWTGLRCGLTQINIRMYPITLENSEEMVNDDTGIEVNWDGDPYIE